VRFQYEYHNEVGQWFRAYGNEQWKFGAFGLMQRREASINDVAERKFHWSLCARPSNRAGLTELGL
jgi:nuclear transport factor 2 (NTF2) superfamily protein